MYSTDYLGAAYHHEMMGDAGFSSVPMTYGATHLGQDAGDDAGGGIGGMVSSVGDFLVGIDGGAERPEGARNSMIAGAVGAAMNVFGSNGSVMGAVADYLIYAGVYNVAMNLASQMSTNSIDIGGLIRESGGAIGGTVVGYVLKSDAVEDRIGGMLPDIQVPVLDIPLASGGGGMFNLMSRFDY